MTMTREQFIGTLEQYRQVLEKAKDALARHGIEGDDIVVNEVSQHDGEQVYVAYTFLWDSMYERDSIFLPIDEFLEDKQ